MPDKYANFLALSTSEPEGSYRIEMRSIGTAVALIAPHAGKIEQGTSEICRSIAGNDLAYYLFEGCKSSNNRDLHITSSRFDEPQGVGIAQTAQVVVTFHGQAGEDHFVNVGGLAEQLCASMIVVLNASGFSASRHSNPMLQGRDPNNICNRGVKGQGLQLEISRALRDTLTADDHTMALFSSTVRSALDGL
ncbi:poly-gamma-glutamate hydrolase family protein [Pseudomonas sp. IT-P395]|uniref:poly-gamma-glutamate hydrolase family protein n=1 Tax=Pseudomonas sp. IT-P395 TaxID=3026459 RepID=UPI0039E0FC24